MVKILHSQSTLTNRYQTTIPEPIRRALHLNKQDKIDYSIDSNGRVFISRVEDDDPVLTEFLSFLANDMLKHPEHIKPLYTALFSRAESLVADVSIDLNAPLSEQDE